MTPPPSRGIGVLVELAPFLGLAPIQLLLADVVLLLAPAVSRTLAGACPGLSLVRVPDSR